MCDFLVAEYWHDFRSSRYVTTESVHLGCTGTQVRSPHRHSGLRIQCCCSCGLGQNGGSDLTPGPRAPHAMGSQKRKERKQTTPPHSPPPSIGVVSRHTSEFAHIGLSSQSACISLLVWCSSNWGAWICLGFTGCPSLGNPALWHRALLQDPPALAES